MGEIIQIIRVSPDSELIRVWKAEQLVGGHVMHCHIPYRSCQGDPGSSGTSNPVFLTDLLPVSLLHTNIV